MPKKKQPKPEPRALSIVCSLCGQSWEAHKADDSGDVSTLECIRLLKARPIQSTYITTGGGTPTFGAANG